MDPNFEWSKTRRTAPLWPPAVLGAIPYVVIASAMALPTQSVGDLCSTEFSVRSALSEPSSYRTTISGESVQGMRVWKQVSYPTEHDFVVLAMSLLERQTTLGAKIQGIISANLSDLYE